MPRNLDRARRIVVTSSHLVDKDKGAHHSEGEADASTNDDFKHAVSPGAIFHHPTPLNAARTPVSSQLVMEA